MCRLVCAFVACKPRRQGFSSRGPTDNIVQNNFTPSLSHCECNSVMVTMLLFLSSPGRIFLTLYILGICLVIFSKLTFQNIFECQAVWIQIRTDILSVLILVETVCKGYQHTTKVAASNERVKHELHHKCMFIR